MPGKRISRRTFLKIAGLGLAGSAAACSGLAYLDTRRPQEPVTFPEASYGGDSPSGRILVAYASGAGSTGGVADAIGQALAQSGAPVDVRLMTNVQDLSPYRAVVAGSAVHGSAWLPEAMQFMQSYQATLAGMPFAAFMVCMTLTMKNETYREAIKSSLDPVRALVRPVSEGYFAGALDVMKLKPWPDRLILRGICAVSSWKEGDFRDWDAIRAWAEGLKPALGV